MEEYSYINDISKSQNLRLYILEHTLVIEELVSKSLGTILNIDWKKSKSFGYSSGSLSFNQKVKIIQDLKGLNKIDSNKLEDLMMIRNKFAHIKSIETFQDFFELSISGKDVKKNLDKYYLTKFSLFKPESEEFRYKFYFFHLSFDILSMLMSKMIKHSFEEGEKVGKIDFLNALNDEVLKLSNRSEIMSKAVEKVKQELKK
jgi:hypothetical protein